MAWFVMMVAAWAGPLSGGQPAQPVAANTPEERPVTLAHARAEEVAKAINALFRGAGNADNAESAVTAQADVATNTVVMRGASADLDEIQNSLIQALEESARKQNGRRAPAGQPTDPVPCPQPLAIELLANLPIKTGWATELKLVDPQQRGWIEGRIEGDDKLVIDTVNIEIFVLDLSKLQLNWSKRIVLRMDGFNSQLKRKPGPKKPFFRTSGGGWRVIDLP